MKKRNNRACVWLLAAVLLGANNLKAGYGTIQDVKHVVIYMEENHSFDDYYGTLQGVRGFNDPNILIFPNGSSDLFQPNGTNFTLPFPLTNGYYNYNRMLYYSRTNLPFYYSLADAYTICDENFCSFMGETFPNRIYLFSGWDDPNGTGGGPVVDDNIPTNGLHWPTYPERLQAAGIDWRVYRPPNDWFGDALQWFVQYRNITNGNPLYDRGIATVPDVIQAFCTDATNGTLPQVSWIIPPDLPRSEHPGYAVELGQSCVQRVLAAIASDPAVYNSTVVILTYDEYGGFFDHVPPPAAPPGTTNEYSRGRPMGLGSRVPMIIVSPWTRGGRVCSQVFDHTSIIRFLENWTGVQEPNISAWRRQTCGDLTSAFTFATPDFSIPTLKKVPTPGVTSGVNVSPPSVQTYPVQEPGVRPACPLPYQPDAQCATGSNGNTLSITMTNAGTASVHYAVYPNACRSDGPWQYDAPSGSSTMDTFVQPSGANGGYDFTCYGPNGFQRRFAGNIQKDYGQIETSSLIDPVGGDIILTLLNSGTNTVNFTVSDNLNGPATNSYSLAAASVTNCAFLAVSNNNGWYDLTVTADADANFLRHLAGHVENGAFSTTEMPVIVGNIFGIPTNPPGGGSNTNGTTGTGTRGNTNSAINSISALVNYLIAQNSLATAGTNNLTLTMGAFGTNCALIYPGWASNFVVQSSGTLAPVSWIPLAGTTTTVSNCNVMILPVTNSGQFFRLSQ